VAQLFPNSPSGVQRSLRSQLTRWRADDRVNALPTGAVIRSRGLLQTLWVADWRWSEKTGDRLCSLRSLSSAGRGLQPHQSTRLDYVGSTDFASTAIDLLFHNDSVRSAQHAAGGVGCCRHRPGKERHVDGSPGWRCIYKLSVSWSPSARCRLMASTLCALPRHVPKRRRAY